MLESMRKHAKFFYVLFFIVILSFIFWGVGTVDKQTTVTVAEVEKEKITVEEFWTAHDRAREFYRNLFKEKFDEEAEKQLNLKQRVLDSLIDEKVLLISAKKAGIKITDEELQDAIMSDPVFVRDGRFNREVYERTLQLNRMSPETFEAMKRRELTVNKMRRLIGEAVDIAEMPPAAGDQARIAMILEMRDKATRSYIEGMKKQLKIMVNQQLIS